MQNNKLNGDLEKFINDEITNSKIWVFCGIMISILLSQMLNLQAEMYKIMYIFKMRQVLDKMSFLFIAIIILEIFLTFFLYKIIINKSKKIIKSSFVVYSLLTGLNLSIFSSVIKVLFQKNIGILPVILLIISLFLVIILIIFDSKKIKKMIKIKVLEDNETEFLEKTRFYVAAVLYTDIVKILILLIISTMILI
ncbi:Uncharacterised protein [uncultured Leptotrichia sp.]|uniref:hypothetical protein n=1 Tax=uncultured Leptotrichia sp. TaxID=159271 RepID=UPI001A45BEB0|nr:hypothetical protein [uncultured Leptotrichia sp.]VTX48821.1 Uncharacterised protein [uncultured Leptotrichia sp.]